MSRERVFVGAGSNLDGPADHVCGGIDDVDALETTHVLRRSSLYRNPAMGPGAQPDYVNAVIEIETGLQPGALLARLHDVEARHGRRRGPERWAPRTLDLDLIAYGDRTASGGAIELPHPGAHERAFVLVPLAEIAPEAHIPGRGAAADLAARVDASGLERIGPADGGGRAAPVRSM